MTTASRFDARVHARTGRRLAATLLLTAAPLALAVPAAAQYDAPPPPAAYAFQNVTVVGMDGAMREGMTVVVRGGVIETLAAGAAVPADAQLLEGEGLHLYPGIVDAHGDVEAEFPEARDIPEDDDDVTAWSPPRSRQGFMPHRRLADAIVIGEDPFEDRLEHGVVASLAHPEGGMAPGHAVVVMHRNTDSPWTVVEDAAAGLTLSFQSAGGVYPSQLFGVIAYLRQAFLDAERYRTMRAAQEEGPPSFIPAGWDPDYEALAAAASGERLVYFVADSDEDIRRVLNLADEFGFRVAIVGGEEAWVHADELARRGIPVHVSLDFDDPDDWDPEADTVPGELSPDAVREKERLEDAWSNPARLAEAGVRFTLTSGGGDADILDGLAKVVEYGLPASDALAAVTTVPAEILGVSNLVRVQEGGPATFMVATGPLLAGEEDVGVRWTFVEGHMTEGAAADGGGGGEAPAGNLTGSWSGSIAAAGQSQDVTLEITQAEDGSLSGTITGGALPPSDISGSISGTAVVLRIEAEGLPEPIELTGTLSEDGNTMTGGGSTPFGEIEFEVTRGGDDRWTRFLGGAR